MKYQVIVLIIACTAMIAGCGSKSSEPTSAANKAPNVPSNPSPSNGAVSQPISVDLSWTGGDPDGDPVTYDVYFGTSSPPSLVSDDQSGTTYDPGLLLYNTDYYWKISAEDDHGAQSEGSIWNFTTLSAYWTETRDASGTYYSITGNYYDPDPSHGAPWIALSSYGQSGADAYWSFSGLSKALVETLAVGAYSYDNGWGADGEWYHVYNHVSEEWDYWGASNQSEKWHIWLTTGSSARQYVRDTDGAVLLWLESGWSDHSHIRQVYCTEEGVAGLMGLFPGAEIKEADIQEGLSKSENQFIEK